MEVGGDVDTGDLLTVGGGVQGRDLDVRVCEVLGVTQVCGVLVRECGDPGEETLLLHSPHHPRHGPGLAAQRVVVRYQHVDRNPAGIKQKLFAFLVSTPLPVSVESVEEILDGIVDPVSRTLAGVQSDDSPGHQGHSVQVSPADDVESLVETLQTVHLILLLKQKHLSAGMELVTC